MNPETLLEIRNLKKYYAVPGERMFDPPKTVKAVDDISLKIERGDSFGLIGESGCGKTTLGRTLLKLEDPTEGAVFIEGRNVFELPESQLRRLRRDVQMIFQDPFSSLNPRMTVEDILAEPFTIHGMLPDPGARRKRLRELMDIVGLLPEHLERFPHQFSGGQRQRIGIARALALNPKLIVCDEPVSALDVSIQAQILNLLQDLQKEFGLTYLFIAHDFSIVRHLCNHVAVMYLGRIVESGPVETLFTAPQHPYTEALLSAIPVPDPAINKQRKRIVLAGDVPNPLDPPGGCHFHPRCRYVADSCRAQRPILEPRASGQYAACPVRPFSETPSQAALVKQDS